MMRNLGITAPDAPVPAGAPLVVYVSERSSDKGSRSLAFGRHVTALRDAVLKRGPALGIVPDVLVEAHEFRRFGLKAQVDMVSRAAVYVTACGGGAVTASFLPRGASVLVYFSPVGGVENNRPTDKPARLDWDYFNNASYLRVHWIPVPFSSRRSHAQDLDTFTDLVLHELQVVYRERLQRETRPW